MITFLYAHNFIKLSRIRDYNLEVEYFKKNL
jgi:hypothetical protein